MAFEIALCKFQSWIELNLSEQLVMHGVLPRIFFFARDYFNFYCNSTLFPSIVHSTPSAITHQCRQLSASWLNEQIPNEQTRLDHTLPLLLLPSWYVFPKFATRPQTLHADKCQYSTLSSRPTAGWQCSAQYIWNLKPQEPHDLCSPLWWLEVQHRFYQRDKLTEIPVGKIGHNRHSPPPVPTLSIVQ